jgi:hypothetical protein
MALRGCCIAHFRGRIVGSYVVDTDRGVISIIVVTDHPEALGMARKDLRSGGTYHVDSYARCNLASTRFSGRTYCAVGELTVDHDYLCNLLATLLPTNEV